MSDKNVEVVRRTVDAFNRGGIDAAVEFFAEEVEFREPPEQPAPRVASGLEEVERVFGQFDEAWEQHRSEVEEIRAVAPDKVLLLSTEHFRGRDGVEVSSPLGSIFTLSNGKIIRWQSFWDRASALEAAGLPD